MVPLEWARKLPELRVFMSTTSFMSGDAEFKTRVYGKLVKAYQVAHEDVNNLEFVGQRVRWNSATAEYPAHISVDQNKKINE